MNIQISREAVELINNNFNGQVFLTYRQYTFNCMCGGGPGEFVKVDKEPYSDHSYDTYKVNDIILNMDKELKSNNRITINVNEKNELDISGFILFDKTKVYNLK